jgi:hypothetical protein
MSGQIQVYNPPEPDNLKVNEDFPSRIFPETKEQ